MESDSTIAMGNGTALRNHTHIYTQIHTNTHNLILATKRDQ